MESSCHISGNSLKILGEEKLCTTITAVVFHLVGNVTSRRTFPDNKRRFKVLSTPTWREKQSNRYLTRRVHSLRDTQRRHSTTVKEGRGYVRTNRILNNQIKFSSDNHIRIIKKFIIIPWWRRGFPRLVLCGERRLESHRWCIIICIWSKRTAS